MNGVSLGSCPQILRGVFVFLGLVLLIACDRQAPIEASVEEVKQVLAVREQAIESKDLELYKSIILKDYSENGMTYDDIVFDIEMLFAKEGDIEYTYQKARPSVTMNSARVVHNVEYKFVAPEKFLRAHETLYMRKVGGQWFISGGMTLGLSRK